MSSQIDVNMNPWQYILYYCNSVNADTTIYQIDLSDVCAFGFDGSNNFIINTWLIGGYIAPTNIQLTSYVLATVLAWYDNFYTIPLAIKEGQTYNISSTSLAAIRSDNTLLGCIVLDTTTGVLRTWSGSTWFTGPDRFLLKDGTNSMAGNLNMNTHSINNCVTLFQSSPSCISIWSSDTKSTSYTANTPEVVVMTGFSQSINPVSDFSYTSTTGECKYIGSVARPFKVTIEYSYTALAVASTQTLYISKNGSTTISGKRKVNSFLLLGAANVVSNTISDIVSLATNNTIQLGGQLSTNNSVSYQAVSYVIEAI